MGVRGAEPPRTHSSDNRTVKIAAHTSPPTYPRIHPRIHAHPHTATPAAMSAFLLSLWTAGSIAFRAFFVYLLEPGGNNTDRFSAGSKGVFHR